MSELPHEANQCNHAPSHLVNVGFLLIDVDDLHLAQVFKNIAGEHESTADSGVEGGDHALNGPSDGDSNVFNGAGQGWFGPFLVLHRKKRFDSGQDILVRGLFKHVSDGATCEPNMSEAVQRRKQYYEDPLLT